MARDAELTGGPHAGPLHSPAGAGHHSFETLSEHDRERLGARLALAVRRARRSGGEVLASITVALDPEVDPSQVVCASRREQEPWFLFEQPDRARAAIAGLGELSCLQAEGSERFASVADRWRAMAAAAVFDPADTPAGSGPVAMGGFAFADDGGRAPHWKGFAPASLSVPEVLLARSERGGKRNVSLTLSALASPDDTAEDLLARVDQRLSELRSSELALLDPAPIGRFQIASAMPPEHYEQAVASAVEMIGSGQLEKIVLAREVQVHAPAAYDPAAVFGVLRNEFPSCFVFCVGRGDATLIAASPELLVRREGQRVSTLALAGSTRRSADPAVDDHLGEQLLRDASYREEHAIVARRIERTLRPHAVWVTAAGEPELVRIANIQHLATPIRAQLAAPMDALELAGLMHPTPAVGGEPLARAAPLIPALEGLDRGWYSGPVGWTDAAGDGEFCVALRCALLRGSVARCYAGNGIVGGSEPASELAETEVKLQALLPLLSG
ncbi:MAG TPA: isochorismate synthase [Solirubrobacteraceae bacterium]|jgi:salicylate biosynthesis isochorismate synthase/menaquinone-specific isochorismate synthase|nr:isochorismate synthase [Solirubrobacteraceae bacterium]